MADSQEFLDLGKKVFFLYPPSVVQEEMLTEIIKNEFEVIILNDHLKALAIFRRYPKAILFINIDSTLKEAEWVNYVQNLMENETTKEIRIGIMTYNNNKDLASKYLMDLMVPCGFIKLTLGLKDSTDIILKALEANEAKGRRKYLRAICKPGSASFNVKHQGEVVMGDIRDISSVGAALAFHKPVNLPNRTLIMDIQLRLKGTLCMVNGVVMGIRESGEKVYIIMFDTKMTPDTRAKIRNYIYQTMQQSVDEEIKTL